jgi:predicted Zn-dependent protease
MSKFKVSFILFLFFNLFVVQSCGVNPATGKKEIQLVSDRKEISMGAQNYPYGQQSSGGIFIHDAELTQYVQSVGQKLTKYSNRPNLPYEFKIVNHSVPNAWAMPGGKIVINRGLLVHLQSEAELAAVLGHEITHAALRHGAQSMERGMLIMAGVVAADILLPNENKVQKQVLLGGAALSATLLQTKYGRDAELEADKYGIDYMVKAGYDPSGAVHLQELFLKMMDKKSPNWLEGLFASHPPSKERLKENQAYAKTLPKGFLGKEEFQKKLANLKKWAPAYKAFDDGLEALKDKKYSKAHELATKAIGLFPEEGLFYQLRGSIYYQEKDYAQAIKAFTESIHKNPDYFYPYQQRGFCYKKLRDYKNAKLDLDKSQKLLPLDETRLALESL